MKALLKFTPFTIAVCMLTLSSLSATAAKLNGVSIHSELGAEQFIAAVYSDTRTSSARQLLISNEDKSMEVRVLADQLYSRRFKRMWVEGIAINAGQSDLEKYAQDLADFTRILRVKLKHGDILRIDRIPGKRVDISINGFLLGSINSPKFFDLLLRTWVGPVPLSSEFKQELLANGNVPKRILKRLESTAPSPNRLASLSRALKSSQKSNKPDPSNKEPLAIASTPPPEKEPTKPEIITEKAKEKAPPKPKEHIVTTVKPTPKIPPPVAVIASIPAPLPSLEIALDDSDIFDDEAEDDEFSASNLLIQQTYISKLTKWTGKFVKYPRFSAQNDQQGTVRVTVLLDRNGKVTDVQVTSKSKYKQLNHAAQKAVKNATPYPQIPDEIKGDEFRFTVPVVFVLR